MPSRAFYGYVSDTSRIQIFASLNVLSYATPTAILADNTLSVVTPSGLVVCTNPSITNIRFWDGLVQLQLDFDANTSLTPFTTILVGINATIQI